MSTLSNLYNILKKQDTFPIVLVLAMFLVVFWVVSLPISPPKTYQFHNIDISGAPFGKNLYLSNTEDQKRSLSDFTGKVIAIYFGFSKCQSICPHTLNTWREVVEHLSPEEAASFQFLFISIRPTTAHDLKEYLGRFSSSFEGLLGSEEEIEETMNEFHVFQEKVEDTYEHTTASFVYDSLGNPRLLVHHENGYEPILEDIRTLLYEKKS